MDETKTGAVICKKPDKEKGLSYEPLLFITNVPHELSDDELMRKIKPGSFKVAESKCIEIIYRSDIQSTSNEVQEVFDHLHPSFKSIRRISYDKLGTFD